MIKARHHFVKFQSFSRVLIEDIFNPLHELVGMFQPPVFLDPQYFVRGHNAGYIFASKNNSQLPNL